jgi:hypothetical protein
MLDDPAVSSDHLCAWGRLSLLPFPGHPGLVVGLAVVAAVASYEHAWALVRARGEARWTAPLVPADGGRVLGTRRDGHRPVGGAGDGTTQDQVLCELI